MNLDKYEKVIGHGQCEQFYTVFNHIFKGNADAIDLCFDILYTFNVWDDIIDDDIDKLTKPEINVAFRNLIDSVPLNPIMMTWGNQLYPKLYDVYNQWISANQFEAKKRDISKAYMLRAGVYGFFVQVAKVLYGSDWADEISFLVYDSYSETLDSLEFEVLD